jgi:DNA-binding transcriptional MocR family regulator
MSDWDLLSYHGIAIVCVARDPGQRLRDLADDMGVTERTAFRVVDELVDEGYLRRYRDGVRSRYEVVSEAALRHPTLQEHRVGELLSVLAPGSVGGGSREAKEDGSGGQSGSRRPEWWAPRSE